jgi:quinol monooxygenase YgiN
MSGCDVIELRRYALHPGARETLIELFERELVEAQEAVGLRVLGTFRDVDDPDSFVWIRGFADMAARGEGLQAFYGGPVWAEHRDAANATMIDSDNVFLLRPVDEQSRLDLDVSRRRAPGVASVTICPLGPGRAPAFVRHFVKTIEPALRAAGANVRARLVTEHAANNYPALPLREGEEVFVWLSLFADERSRDEHVERNELERHVTGQLAGDLDVLRLEPTARSLLPD